MQGAQRQLPGPPRTSKSDAVNSSRAERPHRALSSRHRPRNPRQRLRRLLCMSTAQDDAEDFQSTVNNLYAAVARSATRSIALYFSRPVRLFRPSKGSCFSRSCCAWSPTSLSQRLADPENTCRPAWTQLVTPVHLASRPTARGSFSLLQCWTYFYVDIRSLSLRNTSYPR